MSSEQVLVSLILKEIVDARSGCEQALVSLILKEIVDARSGSRLANLIYKGLKIRPLYA